MRKRTLLVTLSLALVVGLAGIVNAATGSDVIDTQPKASDVQVYVDNNDTPSTEAKQGKTSQNDQTAQSRTDSSEQMMGSNPLMNDQIQNMPMNTQQNMPMSTQMQNMPMNNQMNEQMKNMTPQNMQGQGMAGTNKADNAKASQQGQKSNSNSMMGSMGSMGR
ncbi:MAG: hypothetical protein M0T74_16710 [Desulfitobacterium hafniense]|nr:hypothetical protein [Desulfitobacterium hafniense]